MGTCAGAACPQKRAAVVDSRGREADDRRPMRLWALATLMLPLASVSCQLFFGVEEPSGEATGTSEGGGSAQGTGGAAATSSSTGGAAPTECDLCAEVPPDWQGPVLLATAAGAIPPACPNVVAPELVYEGEPPPHTCSACNCGDPIGECGQATLTCYAGNGCDTGTVLYEGSPDGCNIFLFEDASCKVGAAPAPTSGACGAVPGTVQGSGWGITHALCALAPHDDSCDGGQCFDTGGAPQVEEVCIHAPGDVDCPGAWPSRTLAWASVQDGRTCQCTCTPVGGACVGGGYGLGLFGCGTSVGPGECKQDVALADQEAFEYSADCVISAQGTAGEFVPQDPVTICCQSQAAG
jgi:hypothetical protein